MVKSKIEIIVDIAAEHVGASHVEAQGFIWYFQAGRKASIPVLTQEKIFLAQFSF